jgi:hypothetical protein
MAFDFLCVSLYEKSLLSTIAGFLAFGFAAFSATVFVGVLAFLGLAAFGFTADFIRAICPHKIACIFANK